MLNFGHLRELDKLFELTDFAIVLVCLAQGIAAGDGQPLHFRELARTIVDQSGSYVPEGNINRVLTRFKKIGYVTVEDEHGRHPAYRLTPLGQQKADLLIFVMEAVENRDNPPPPEDSDQAPSDPDEPDP